MVTGDEVLLVVEVLLVLVLVELERPLTELSIVVVRLVCLEVLLGDDVLDLVVVGLVFVEPVGTTTLSDELFD